MRARGRRFKRALEGYSASLTEAFTWAFWDVEFRAQFPAGDSSLPQRKVAEALPLPPTCSCWAITCCRLRNKYSSVSVFPRSASLTGPMSELTNDGGSLPHCNYKCQYEGKEEVRQEATNIVTTTYLFLHQSKQVYVHPGVTFPSLPELELIKTCMYCGIPRIECWLYPFTLQTKARSKWLLVGFLTIENEGIVRVDQKMGFLFTQRQGVIWCALIRLLSDF